MLKCCVKRRSCSGVSLSGSMVMLASCTRRPRAARSCCTCASIAVCTEQVEIHPTGDIAPVLGGAEENGRRPVAGRDDRSEGVLALDVQLGDS